MVKADTFWPLVAVLSPDRVAGRACVYYATVKSGSCRGAASVRPSTRLRPCLPGSPVRATIPYEPEREANSSSAERIRHEEQKTARQGMVDSRALVVVGPGGRFARMIPRFNQVDPRPTKRLVAGIGQVTPAGGARSEK